MRLSIQGTRPGHNTGTIEAIVDEVIAENQTKLPTTGQPQKTNKMLGFFVGH